jgi:hypothetical protein
MLKDNSIQSNIADILIKTDQDLAKELQTALRPPRRQETPFFDYAVRKQQEEQQPIDDWLTKIFAPQRTIAPISVPSPEQRAYRDNLNQMKKELHTPTGLAVSQWEQLSEKERGEILGKDEDVRPAAQFVGGVEITEPRLEAYGGYVKKGPLDFNISPLGGAYERLEEKVLNTVNQPVVGGLSVPDLAGLALAGFGIGMGAQQGFKALLQSSVSRNFNSWLKGNPDLAKNLDQDVRQGISNVIFNNLWKNSKTWLTKNFIKTVFNPTKAGQLTQEATKATDDVVTALIKQVSPQLTKFTQTNTGVPGQTMSMSQLIKSIEGIVPQTAQAMQGVVAELPPEKIPEGVTPLTGAENVPPVVPKPFNPSEGMVAKPELEKFPATQRIKAIQQKGLENPEIIPANDARDAHIELAAPDGPKPPKPPIKTAKGTDEPDDIVGMIVSKATEKERPDQTLLRLHEAAINNNARRSGLIVREGNKELQNLGIGVTRRGQLIPRDVDIPKLDALYNALHNPSKVQSGEISVPAGFEKVYEQLRNLTDWEQAARLDFDPEMATVDDYFYRGWKPPEGSFANVTQGRPLVRKPAFKKPRVNATYQEMRDLGFEPLFWNPYQQWGLSRTQGVKYREQMKLVEYLKGMGEEFARPHTGGPIPSGWRVPEVGPAFEGKPFSAIGADGEPTTMFTRRWIVPNNIANTLENMYGKRPDIGKFMVGSKTIDPLAVIDFLTFVPKRAKLMFSFFQQQDFLNRSGAGSWTRMTDALMAGQPIEAVKALARYPATVSKILAANFSPTYRQSIKQQLDSTEPLVKGRLGITLKGISDAGLSTFDPAMFRWEEMDKLVRVVAKETGVIGKVKGAAGVLGDLESAMRRGLFEGVYPAAMITDIKNNVAPMVARMYPKLNDEQVNGTIARLINIKYSSIPASQSVIQNRAMREVLRRVFFSMGESEGLLRQAAGTLIGTNKRFWAKHWLGVYLFLIAVANVIHFASTGEPLPKERYTPISKNKWGPLPIGYNTQFASPTIPLKGTGGEELTLDVVGQMDTALRLFDPGFFLTARESVPIRSAVNQVSGTDFYGRPIDDVGPGGILSRTVQLLRDMFAPIGAGGITEELVRQNVPGAEDLINEGESRIGLPGLAIQASGANVRSVSWRTAWEDDFKEYLDIPSNAIELKAAQQKDKSVLSRTDYREKNPEIDAKLFLTGQTTTLRTTAGINITRKLIQEHGIDPETIKGVQKWQDEQEQREETGIADTSITPTEKFIMSLLAEKPKQETPQPIPQTIGSSTQQSTATQQWNEIINSGGTAAAQAFDKYWNKKQALTPQEENILKALFAKYPLGQTNFNTWYKQTMRQLFLKMMAEQIKK